MATLARAAPAIILALAGSPRVARAANASRVARACFPAARAHHDRTEDARPQLDWLRMAQRRSTRSKLRAYFKREGCFDTATTAPAPGKDIG